MYPKSTSSVILEVLWGLRLIAYLMLAHHLLTYLMLPSSRLTFGRAQASLALHSLNRLLPRILVAYWAVLEFLAADGYFLVVLLAVCPILLEMYAVAACTLDGLHG